MEAAKIPDAADNDNPEVGEIEEAVPDPEKEAEPFSDGWYQG